MTEVHEYVDQLRSEGEMQARGRFTLDPKKSRQKIADMQQSDLSGWAGWWTRAGVALGAMRGSFDRPSPTSLTARWDFEPSSLEAVTRYLVSGDVGDEHSALDLFRNSLLWVQALLADRPGLEAELQVELPGQPDYRLALGTEQLTVARSGEPGRKAALRLCLQDLSGKHLSALSQALHSGWRQRVRFCRIPVELNGVLLNSPLPDPTEPLLYLGYYLCRQRKSVLALPDPRGVPAHQYMLGTQNPQVFKRPRVSAPLARANVLGVAGQLSDGARWSESHGIPILSWQDEESHELFLDSGEPLRDDRWHLEGRLPWLVRLALLRSAGPDRVTVVHQGLMLNSEEFALEPHGATAFGWHAVVAMDDAQTDVSGTRCVQGPAYERMLAWVGGEIVDIHRCQVAAR